MKDALRKTQYKSPEIDQVLNFWLNVFDSINDGTTNCLNKAVNNPELKPKWLTQGVTYLQPKSNETNIPKNCQSITCLPTIV